MIKINVGHSTQMELIDAATLELDPAEIARMTRELGNEIQETMERQLFTLSSVNDNPSTVVNASAPAPTRLTVEALDEALKMLPDKYAPPVFNVDYASIINSATLYSVFQRYQTAYFSHSALPVARRTATRTTTRKDGREQQTCECGCCGYPHRAGSVKGCES